MQIKINCILLIVFVFSFGTVFSQEKSSLEAQFNKTLTPEQRKAYKDEIQLNSKKIHEDPTIYVFYLRRGVAYSNLGLHPDAIADFNKVIKLDPKVPEAYYNRGISRARFRFTKTACQDVQKAGELGLESAKTLYTEKCKMYFSELGTF